VPGKGLDGLNGRTEDGVISQLSEAERSAIIERIKNAKDLAEVTRLENQLRGEPMSVD
jgi:hypothetical protein